MLFIGNADLLLVRNRYLRIRNDVRKKQCVCFSTFRTSDAAYAETDGAVRKLNASVIVTMNGQAGRMTTGTGDLVKLDTINDRIIKGLRNMLAILDKNGYHSIVKDMGLPMSVVNGGLDFSRVQVRCFFVITPMVTKRYSINQSDVFSVRIFYAVPYFNLAENMVFWHRRKR